MKKEPFVSAIIVAAGSGTRMGGVSKPELTLNGKALLQHVTEAFLQSSVDEIVIVCGTNRPRLEALVPSSPAKPIRFCDGGNTRTKSVFNGVDAADKRATILCVHDCARPFVTKEIIEAVIEEAKKTGAATACTPVTDTIKYVDEEHSMLYTPGRKYLLALQTPQVFRKDAYLAAYALASKAGSAFTDETAMLEQAGFRVAYVPCPASNRKITTKEDLTLARALVLIRQKEEKAKEKTV
ncbi:MAG: 2-C-methyl-D-erythritol 4-phosphate cytidylyltransferase [Clostridiales bacterium]|nr:2-C-methyl-D-erythritol 4-phosphate cytidylyltransferase [Candidatus Coliplasma caballi]